MVTVYQIPCSCGCGELVQRPVYKSGACKVRAYRDKDKQMIVVDGGEAVSAFDSIDKKMVAKAAKESNKMQAEIDPPVSIGTAYDPKGWQPPVNLSKAHFARRSKHSKKS